MVKFVLWAVMGNIDEGRFRKETGNDVNAFA
jgi:hypothetical protein